MPINLDLSLIMGSPEIDSLIEWVLKVLALGGLIITQRDGELTIHPKPSYGNDQLELPPLPVSPERAAFLFHNSPRLWEKLRLHLADLDHAHRHTRIWKSILVHVIQDDRDYGGIKFGSDWYVLRTWKRRGYPPPHPPTKHTFR